MSNNQSRLQFSPNGNYSFHIKVLNIFLLVISILFIISLIINFINSFQLELQLDNEGIENLLNIYSSSFKLGAGVITILSILVALRRMRQTNQSLFKTEQQLTLTEQQLQLTLDNIKFNNFYRHREEFIKYLLDSEMIKFIATSSKIDIKYLCYEYFKIYFKPSYRDFEAEINTERIKNYATFIKELSELNILFPEESIFEESLSEIDLMKLNSVCDKDSIHYYEIIRSIKYLIEASTKANIKYHLLPDEDRIKLEKLIYIYYRIHIFLEIYSFTGLINREYSNPEFMASFKNYCDQNQLGVLIFKNI